MSGLRLVMNLEAVCTSLGEVRRGAGHPQRETERLINPWLSVAAARDLILFGEWRGLRLGVGFGALGQDRGDDDDDEHQRQRREDGSIAECQIELADTDNAGADHDRDTNW